MCCYPKKDLGPLPRLPLVRHGLPPRDGTDPAPRAVRAGTPVELGRTDPEVGGAGSWAERADVFKGLEGVWEWMAEKGTAWPTSDLKF